ncbi:hypothetical protein HMPREF9074_07538 [Capnocytophaga sp. oral taxon 329 str. F0087]|nr:hypothetical protein HMPREF9074_07538 [Capnocytophaga sp. oral taxon 329 str. F0087]
MRSTPRLFYAAKVRQKIKPRKKLSHRVTTLYQRTTELSEKRGYLLFFISKKVVPLLLNKNL